MPPIISAIYPVFNQSARFENCITALAKQLQYLDSEIVLIRSEEDHETSEIAAALKTGNTSLKEVVLPAMHSIPSAFNSGASRASGEYYLFIQPWMELRPEALEMMLEQIRGDRHTGLITPRVQHTNGTIYPTCQRFPLQWDIISASIGLNKLFPKSGLFNRVMMGDFHHEDIKEVDGSRLLVWMVRRITWEKVGAFDENFPHHFYDIDWCRRLQNSGYRILYYPLARAVTHQPESDTGSLRYQISQFRLLDKHYDQIHQQVLNLVTGIFLYGLLPLCLGIRYLYRLWIDNRE